ncbi:glutaminyl-tRNA synthetase [Candidatus Kinetoplastibacterium oncopeltii TCC290E]|uniref:Glutamine--tRNA ligase n=1 Tax=Candidatus Kinetoplastidibacterium stringomonadis TCC290E TaxID=1208920 RepID=M1L7F8_9PROT|nr:glutamine--tRNA ligase/YqeY domain fusion protein [Candidatus Kinetoplastibacterium oncopeltii]AGF48528.1 glutaminyl-tRNA synthetase [Candidatus Kinetoplastibacterium oncopeltii TCC290E]
MTTIENNMSSQNFLRRIIEEDINSGKLDKRLWSGIPGPSNLQKNIKKIDFASIRTRFPPEPNGYLHIGHAKSICINFGLAEQYNGSCHLRFDDTNPDKEDKEYVESIIEAVNWLGFKWINNSQNNLYFASDYFNYMYEFAEELIKNDYAYIDEQNEDEIKHNRGTLTNPGIESPWRNRPSEESLILFRRMKNQEYPNGSLVLRAKIDMKSPNVNMRDPIMYRIRHSSHHRTGSKWCIYPMYSWAHPVEDALEGITHSICTLEFEDQRSLYDWFLEKLKKIGIFSDPLPHQYEFARLNLSYVVTSKRKLLTLVKGGYVDGWDDPRLPTIFGLRRRGYTPRSIRLFCERISVSKSDSLIDYSILEQALRDDLDIAATRAIAILNPLKLIITNYPINYSEICHAPINHHDKNLGYRNFSFQRELWIDKYDFQEDPQKNYFRLFPGNLVRLKYGYIVRCTGCRKDSKGNIIEVHAEYLPDTKSGTDGSNRIKVKGNITWLSSTDAQSVTINLYEHLFTKPILDSDENNFIDYINPNSKKTITALLEPNTINRDIKTWQFERLGYFIMDKDSTDENIVINRIVTLKDSYIKN